MYKFLRSVKRAVYQVKSYFLFVFVVLDYLKFKNKDKSRRFSVPLGSVMPCLFENTPYTRFDTHYIYHTSWAARKVAEIRPQVHTDISSSLYFSTIVSAFQKVNFYDFRPAKLNLSNLNSRAANLLNLDFADESLESVSCMHTVEHVGLGRYGDKIDPDGDTQAASELSRVVKKGGSLLFVVPVGKSRIQWNAHRIYSYEMIMNMFQGLKLKEFSLIPDDALERGIIINADPKEVSKQAYACGCFWFVKE